MLVGGCSIVWICPKWGSNVIDGKTEIRMVEEIEELKSDSEYALFPAGKLRVLHDG
jgi:hypothetical protein